MEPLQIAPLRGVLYSEQASPLSDVLAPPYDVISTAERETLAAKSAHGIVHVLLPAGAGDERYEKAARLYREWLAQGLLRRDERPAIYRYRQSYSAEGQSYTRTGFIARVKLRRFEERVVVPHERTLSAPKADRLKLTRACGAWFSQVFGLYSDPRGETEEAFRAIDERAAELRARTDDGTVHELSRLTDESAQRSLMQAMSARRVYIADGHHRYETMLALRDELRSEDAQYGPFFLCRMEDPGLRALPTHRVVHSLASFDLKRFLAAAGEFFAVEPTQLADAEALRAELSRRGQRAPTFACAHGAQIHLLSLRPGAEASVGGPPVLRRLDVTLLHSLIFERILGIDRAAQEKQTNLRYVKDLAQALREARSPDVQTAFLLNPTRVSDLKEVADAGEVMPQKSTYFFPKLASGLVNYPIL